MIRQLFNVTNGPDPGRSWLASASTGWNLSPMLGREELDVDKQLIDMGASCNVWTLD